MDAKFKEDFDKKLGEVKIAESEINKENLEALRKNPDIVRWLHGVQPSTSDSYLRSMLLFLRSTNMDDPTILLDLKTKYEDKANRFFPAEDLLKMWKVRAIENCLSSAKIKKVIDSVRSFYKFNYAKLEEVKASYKPPERGELNKDMLRKFRDGFSWYGKIVFDFLVSVPVRDGQFSKCPRCGKDFFPRWDWIEGFPEIKPMAKVEFIPSKGHESSNYGNLRQICFLTVSASESLNGLKRYKEKLLGRQLQPDEFIFTFLRNKEKGQKGIAPIGKQDIQRFFRQAQSRIGMRIYPHLIRSWVNTSLDYVGIPSIARNVYLGHDVGEQNYSVRQVEDWKQKLIETKALDWLDITNGTSRQIAEVFKTTDELRKELAQKDEVIRVQKDSISTLEHSVLQLQSRMKPLEEFINGIELIRNAKVIKHPDGTIELKTKE